MFDYWCSCGRGMGDLMRQELQGLLLIGASFGGLTLALLAGTAGAAHAQGQPPIPGQVFRDCADVCPEMVVVPWGSFTMGSPASVAYEAYGVKNESPQHQVTIGYAFAVGRFEVTYNEWDACVNAGGCPAASNTASEGPNNDNGWGRGRRPVIYVSWNDAESYVRWLSSMTGQRYRLLSESEWEYSARAGTTTPYSTGDSITADDANFVLTGPGRTVPVGSFAPNAFGLYDMHGNVWEWVQDCYDASYFGAPTDGASSTEGDCTLRVIRGGAWNDPMSNLRSARRLWEEVFRGFNIDRGYNLGFRVARTL
jgi:formylglycine-generating enzyme required for sulfatase activity